MPMGMSMVLSAWLTFESVVYSFSHESEALMQPFEMNIFLAATIEIM